MTVNVITIDQARQYIYNNHQHAVSVYAKFIVWIGDVDLLDVYLFMDWFKTS